MHPFLLALDISSTTFHSETDAEAFFLPELRLDVYDSLHAVRVPGAER